MIDEENQKCKKKQIVFSQAIYDNDGLNITIIFNLKSLYNDKKLNGRGVLGTVNIFPVFNYFCIHKKNNIFSNVSRVVGKSLYIP